MCLMYVESINDGYGPSGVAVYSMRDMNKNQMLLDSSLRASRGEMHRMVLFATAVEAENCGKLRRPERTTSIHQSASMNDLQLFSSIKDLLERTLKAPFAENDSIRDCDPSLLSLLRVSPEVAREHAYEQLYAVAYKDVAECWRRLYTESSMWIALDMVEEVVERIEQERIKHDSVEGSVAQELGKIVEELDRAVIMTGAPVRRHKIEEIFGKLSYLQLCRNENLGIYRCEDGTLDEHEGRRRKLSSTPEANHPSPEIELEIPHSYPSIQVPDPPLRFTFRRMHNLSLEEFQSQLELDHKNNRQSGSLPFIITHAIDDWPAFHDNPWRNPRYLLSKTLGGRRLVPIEIGQSYTDSDWSQKIITMKEFMMTYMLQRANAGSDSSQRLPDTKPSDKHKAKLQTGYLAQHDLLTQIPTLATDIRIPDYCYSTPPTPKPPSSNAENSDEVSDSDTIMVNTWLGPAHTKTPLHTDPHHNILAQVVGRKYVRLYAPSESVRMYPRGWDGEWGVDMGNTSCVDLEEVMGFVGYEGDGDGDGDGGERQRRKIEFLERFPDFLEAEYVEGVLGEGECLFIPRGWWHYVRSLSASFSVSFWWD